MGAILFLYAGRLWSHFRMAFIPMSYLYGKKFVGPITRLVISLREELHIHPYKKIDWKEARKLCAKVSSLNLTHFCLAREI
jgi:hypothetical protein